MHERSEIIGNEISLEKNIVARSGLIGQVITVVSAPALTYPC